MSYKKEHDQLKIATMKQSLRLTQKALKLGLMEFDRISYQKKAAPEVIEALKKAVEHIDWCLEQVSKE